MAARVLEDSRHELVEAIRTKSSEKLRWVHCPHSHSHWLSISISLSLLLYSVPVSHYHCHSCFLSVLTSGSHSHAFLKVSNALRKAFITIPKGKAGLCVYYWSRNTIDAATHKAATAQHLHQTRLSRMALQQQSAGMKMVERTLVQMARGETGLAMKGWIQHWRAAEEKKRLDAVAALSEQQLHAQRVRGLRAMGRLLAQMLLGLAGVCVLEWRRGAVDCSGALLDAQVVIAELRKKLAVEREEGVQAVQAEAENSGVAVMLLENSIQVLTRQSEAEKAVLMEEHRHALVSD